MSMTPDVLIGGNLRTLEVADFSTVARAIIRQTDESTNRVRLALLPESSVEILTDGTVRETLVYTENAFPENGPVIVIIIHDGRVINYQMKAFGVWYDFPVNLVNGNFGSRRDAGEIRAEEKFYHRITTAPAWEELADEFALLDEWSNDTDRDFPPVAWERYNELYALM